MNEKLFKSNHKAALAATLSDRIGHIIATENVHTDESGWFYYIPANSLKAKHPLIMNHYRGPLFVVIPLQDMKEIENEKITVPEYIDTAIWSYGYFWGGGALLSGVYWQILEGGKPGINDKAKIERYLTILACRTHKRSSGYMPTEQRCANCKVESCPFSKYIEKNYDAGWDKEVQENDARVDLYRAVKRRIHEQFGLDVISFHPHTGDSHYMRLYAGHEPGTVEVRVPQDILVDLLYTPEKYDVNMLADGFGIEAANRWKNDNNGQLINDQFKILQPSECDHIEVGALYEFWSLDERFDWFAKKPLEEEDDDEFWEEEDDTPELSTWEKIVNFFKNLFA